MQAFDAKCKRKGHWQGTIQLHVEVRLTTATPQEKIFSRLNHMFSFP